MDLFNNKTCSDIYKPRKSRKKWSDNFQKSLQFIAETHNGSKWNKKSFMEVISISDDNLSPSIRGSTDPTITDTIYNISKGNDSIIINDDLEVQKINNSRRGTYELDKSVNDISLLKQNEIKSFHSTNDPSKCTKRRNVKFSFIDSRSSIDYASVFNKSILKNDKYSTPMSTFKGKSIKKSNNKKSSKGKIPNFALIHQKAYDKMEDIEHYKKRREERAKSLLSGHKPLVSSSIVNSNNESTKTPNKSKKHLSFAPGSTPKQKSTDFSSLPFTPIPSKSILNRKTFSPIFNEPLTNNAKDSIFTSNEKNNIFNFSESSKDPKKQNLIEKKSEHNISKRVEMVKEIVSKKPKAGKIHNEKTKSYVKGVRSNRRFDLLMKMRNK